MRSRATHSSQRPALSLPFASLVASHAAYGCGAPAEIASWRQTAMKSDVSGADQKSMALPSPECRVDAAPEVTGLQGEGPAKGSLPPRSVMVAVDPGAMALEVWAYDSALG